MKLRKLFFIFAIAALSFGLYAQDDDFAVSLDEDLSSSSGSGGTGGGTNASKSSWSHGLWLQAHIDSNYLIRDVATGEEKGFELDKVNIDSEAEWWMYGNIRDKVFVRAGFRLWKFDQTLFEASKVDGADPIVSWRDGFENFFTLPFSPLEWGNNQNEALGLFKKAKFGLENGYIDAYMGWGDFNGEDGTASFKGIYTTIDQWECGFSEIRLGKNWQEYGDFKFNMAAGFGNRDSWSPQYGMYDLFSLTYQDRYTAAVTFSSKTDSSRLFDYGDADTNALSLYVSAMPWDFLQLELHGLATFGEEQDWEGKSMAGAFRAKYISEPLNVSAKFSIAGEAVDSIWGSDQDSIKNTPKDMGRKLKWESYDDINADSIDVSLSLEAPNVTDFLALGLDADANFGYLEDLSKGDINTRIQPTVDVDFSEFSGLNMKLGAYAVMDFGRQDYDALKDDFDRYFYFDEIGLQLDFFDIGIPRLTFDYAIKTNTATWNDKDVNKGYVYTDRDYSEIYHSFLVSADITNSLNIQAGAIIRANDAKYSTVKDREKEETPFAFALAFKYKNIPIIGHPTAFVHFSYSMWPWYDNEHTIRRRDGITAYPHRTYLIHDLDCSDEHADRAAAQVTLGMEWNF